jgi:predicted permease
VRDAALTSSAPFTGFGVVFNYELPDLPPDPDAQRLARFRIVSPELFATLGLPLLRGRAFAAGEDDGGGAPGAVVSEDLVRRWFPNTDPLGRPIETAGDTFRIVGVVPTVRDVNTREPSPFPFIYVPVMPATRQSMTLVVRADGDPAALVGPVRQMIRELAPNQPVTPLQPMSELIASSNARPRFMLQLLTSFAAVTLLLAGVGLYGLLAYTLGRRTHEIGVRMALGAPARRVRSMLLAHGMVLAVLGAALGSGLALWGGRYLETLLFEVQPRDPAVLAAVAVTLLGVAFAAAWFPARRATRIAPLEALKSE